MRGEFDKGAASRRARAAIALGATGAPLTTPLMLL
jgi:hypothetical protein